jgi:hypothetical protein
LDVATSWIDLQEQDIRELSKASAKCIKRATAASNEVPVTPVVTTPVTTITNNTTTPSAMVETSNSSNKNLTMNLRCWMAPEPISPTPAKKKTRITPQATNSPLPSAISASSTAQCLSVKDRMLDPKKGSFCNRLNHCGIFHCPEPRKKNSARCALHRWMNRDWQVFQGVVCCSHCAVHLCIPCFKIFHTERDIIKKKGIISENMKADWEENHRRNS